MSDGGDRARQRRPWAPASAAAPAARTAPAPARPRTASTAAWLLSGSSCCWKTANSMMVPEGQVVPCDCRGRFRRCKQDRDARRAGSVSDRSEQRSTSLPAAISQSGHVCRIGSDDAADAATRDHVADEVIVHAQQAGGLCHRRHHAGPAPARISDPDHGGDRDGPRRVARRETAIPLPIRPIVERMEAVGIVADQRRVVVDPGLRPVATGGEGQAFPKLVGQHQGDAPRHDAPAPSVETAPRRGGPSAPPAPGVTRPA